MKKRNTTYRLNIVDYLIFIICSLAAAAALILFYRDLNSYTIKQAEAPVAKIYFKKNTAQRKFVDNDIWEVLTNSSDIYDGDRIRTSKDSEAYTEFNDSGIQIQLREKSMVQIFKNKKERSVDFIGGEIFVATTKPEEKLVIHSGKNEISIGQVSEVKLALPEVPAAVASGEEEAVEESPVVIEVISGQVEVVEQPAPAKTKAEKTEKKEAEPIVLSAGESLTLIPQIEEKAPVVEEPVQPVVEEVAEVIVEETDEEIVETPEPEADAEPVIEEVVQTKAAPVVEKKPEPLVEKKAEPVVEKKPEPVVEKQPEPAVEKAPPPPQKVVQGVEKILAQDTTLFQKSYYDQAHGKYNYAHGFSLSDITGNNKTIPAGALIEYTIKGWTNKDLNRFVIQMSTGEDEWKQAHAFIETCPNNGAGMKMNVPFEEKTTLILTNDVVNTDKAWVNMSYEPKILDEPVLFYNMQVKVKVLSLNAADNIKTIESGYTKTIEYKDLTFVKDQWGEKKNDYDYKIRMSAESVFGSLKYIPAGTKIKMTVSGKCDTQVGWLAPEFVYAIDEWVQLLTTDGDIYKIRFNKADAIQKNRQFNYSATFKTYKDLPNTLEGIFSLVIGREDYIKTNPTFENLTITFEVE